MSLLGQIRAAGCDVRLAPHGLRLLGTLPREIRAALGAQVEETLRELRAEEARGGPRYESTALYVNLGELYEHAKRLREHMPEAARLLEVARELDIALTLNYKEGLKRLSELREEVAGIVKGLADRYGCPELTGQDLANAVREIFRDERKREPIAPLFAKSVQGPDLGAFDSVELQQRGLGL